MADGNSVPRRSDRMDGFFMITANPLLGTLLHATGALAATVCYTPQKATRGWSWQTTWLAQASVCWLVLPVLVAWLTIPELWVVLQEAPREAMGRSFLLGALYGVGGTAFGLAIRSIGFSLSPASQQLMISEQPIHAVIPRLDVNFRLPTGSCRAVTDQNRKAFG